MKRLVANTPNVAALAADESIARSERSAAHATRRGRGASRPRTSVRRARHAAAIALCALAFVGCGGGDGTGPASQHGAPLPDALVGQWQNGISAPPGLNDWLAQTYNYPVPNVDDIIEIQSSTLGYAWYFGEDGRYEHIWMWDTIYAYGSCVRKHVWQERGTVTLGGSTLTLSPASARFTALDSCAPEMATDGPAQVGRQTFTATLGQDAAGEDVLTLTYPSGSQLALYRPSHWSGSGMAAPPSLSASPH